MGHLTRRRMRARGLSSLLGAFVLMGLLGAQTSPGAAATAPWATLGPELVPAHGALLGTWSLPRSGRTDMQELAYVESEIGEPFAIYHTYLQASTPLPTPDMRAAASSGHINLVDITPGASWASVAAGGTDSELVAQADGLKAFGYPVMVSFDHEANARIGSSGTPAQFVAAWRHVYDVYQQQGATNVIFVWDMTGELFLNAQNANAMYPGSQYVDWVAADAYNWDPVRAGAPWRSFQQAFQPFYTWAVQTGKPAMAEETGVLESPSDANAKAQWYAGMATTVEGWPNLKAVVYFNSSRDGAWWFDSTPQALAAFRAVAQSPYFNPETQEQPQPPVETAAPAITGTAQAGSTLQAHPGAWTGATSVGDRWEDCPATGSCTPIAGATGATYTVQDSDVGDAIGLLETATNGAGSATAAAAPTAPVLPAAPVDQTPPTVSGTLQPGSTLAGTAGTWQGSPATFAYQWLSCAAGACAPITGANASTLTVPPSLAGDTIALSVTAANAGGSGAATSAQTAPVSVAGPAAVTPLPLVKSGRIVFALYQPATVTVEIADASGAVIRHKVTAHAYAAGTVSVGWSRMTDAGTRVGPGSYQAVVIATGQGGTTWQQSVPFTVGSALASAGRLYPWSGGWSRSTMFARF